LAVRLWLRLLCAVGARTQRSEHRQAERGFAWVRRWVAGAATAIRRRASGGRGAASAASAR
jgi:hypothetical protein